MKIIVNASLATASIVFCAASFAQTPDAALAAQGRITTPEGVPAKSVNQARSRPVAGDRVDINQMQVQELEHRARIITLDRSIEEEKKRADLEEQRARKIGAESKQERAVIELESARTELNNVRRGGGAVAGTEGLVRRDELMALLDSQRMKILATTARSAAAAGAQQKAQPNIDGLPSLVGILSDGRALLQDSVSGNVFEIRAGDTVEDFVVKRVKANTVILAADDKEEVLKMGK